MGLIARVSEAIALGEASFELGPITREAGRLLAFESPWYVDETVGRVVSEVLGLGPIQKWFDDPRVTDVLVNAPDEVWIDRGDGLELTETRFGSRQEIATMVERCLAPLGLRLDRTRPMVDARLPDGSRLHAVLPPASVGSPLVAVRRFSQRVSSLEGLIAEGSATREQVDLLIEAVRSREAIVISGGTGAGKTTLLNLLAGHIPPTERVVTIEDAAELSLPGHVVRLEAHPPNAEGVGEVTVRDLLRSALRLRPDRIVVGEVRGAEAIDLVSAMNTGHRGSMTTVHANSPDEAMWRLETLALSSDAVSELAVVRQLEASVDWVVQIDRVGNGRQISAISDRRSLRGAGR